MDLVPQGSTISQDNMVMFTLQSPPTGAFSMKWFYNDGVHIVISLIFGGYFCLNALLNNMLTVANKKITDCIKSIKDMHKYQI